MKQTWWLFVCLGTSGAFGQTLVDLRTQAKSVDFSGATATKPFKSGAVLPAICSVGEMFFQNSAPSGSNLFGCTALNSWSLQGGAVTGGDVSGILGNLIVTQIQTHAVAPLTPSSGQFLGWNANNNRWEPMLPPAGGQSLPSPTGNAGKFFTTDGASLFWTTPSGDISGTLGGISVVGLQGRAVSSAAPFGGQVLAWNSGTTRWEPQNVSSSGPAGPAGPQGPTGPQGPVGPQGPAGSGSGGSGASSASQLTDFAVAKSSGAALTIGANCSPSTPCNVRFGSVTYAFASGASVTLSGGTGFAYIYVSSSGTLTVGHNLNLACLTGCIAQSGITSFPADSVPLFTWSATNGTWDPAGLDQRAFLTTRNILAGPGIITTDSLGQTLVSVDSSAVSLRVPVPPTSSSPGSPGNWATDGSFFYLCTAINVWLRTGLASW